MLHSILCFVFVYILRQVSFHDNLCFFHVSHLFEFSCWLSSTNNLIWIFIPFVSFIEVVSLWLVLVIVIGIPGLIAATDFFLCSLKKQIKYLWYGPPQYLPFPFCHLLTKNCGRYWYLQGCWPILSYWLPSIARKTSRDNVFRGVR